MQEKVSIIVVPYGQKFPSLGSRFGITRRSLVMPNRDPRDGNFRPYLTPMKDTYRLRFNVCELFIRRTLVVRMKCCTEKSVSMILTFIRFSLLFHVRKTELHVQKTE